MIAYLDCSSGISGDKLLGALIDLGVSPDDVTAACTSVGLDARVRATRVTRGGIAAHAVEVESQATEWREWATIRQQLESAPLAPAVLKGALRAFELLAQTEASVHGVEIEQVHFHEVGAADTVADLLGVALGLDLLRIERLVCSAVAVGSGTVQTRHGLLPIPAPATSLLLEGIPVYGGSQTTELTTPTGAALLRTHGSAFGAMPPMTPARVGRGAGSRALEGQPNVATLIVGEPAGETAPLRLEPVTLLVTNIDHITPEHAAHASDRLREAGALDVWQKPLVMKKGRAGIELTVLCAPEDEPRLAESVARETGTLGIRVQRLERYEAPRDADMADTRFGPVRVKRGPAGVRPEHDEVERIASETGQPYGHVAEAIAEDIA